MNLGVVGGKGKLGSIIVNVAQKDNNIDNVIVIESNDELVNSNGLCDMYIDCTSASAFMENLKTYSVICKPIAIATTGFSKDELNMVKQMSNNMAIMLSPNFSIGVYNFLKIVRVAAELLNDDFDVSVLEAHHRWKKDKPSGTAKKIAEVINEINEEKEVEINSIRAGNIVGEHEVLFANSESERIVISHKISSRESFAKGAVTSVKWLLTKDFGFYSMKDMLG